MIGILSRKDAFVELFTQQAGVLHEAAGVLLDLMEGTGRDICERANHIKALEHRGDSFTHDIMTRLNRTFVTALEREDIHMLSSRLDDVLDLIDAASTRMLLFKIDQSRPPGIELARIIKRGAAEILAAVPHISNNCGKMLPCCEELHRLEHEADTVCRNALAQLFEEERDPIALIKWKEIFEVLEFAVDKAEDVSDVLQTIVLKNA